MIPILFKSDATNFSTFGIGVLSDCLSCTVTEERNGAFECILTYPITGKLYEEISKERLIKAKANDTSDNQMFRIYRITTPIDGVVTIFSQHISYDLVNIATLQWSSDSISPSLAMERVFTETASIHDFTCSTDFSEARNFAVNKPQSIRACLGGTEGSFLDVWGGEFEWDNKNVILHSQRGQNTGVVIEYGKNLTELEHDDNNSYAYTNLLPYAVSTSNDGVETIVTLTEITLPITSTGFTRTKTLIKDFTEFFDSGVEITESQLRSTTQDYISHNPLGITIPTLTISFEPLWKLPEYPAILERVSLCDTVTIRHWALGITSQAKVITTVYNTLEEKYISITLGSATSSLLNNIFDAQETADKAKEKIERFPALMTQAINSATSRITGQTGGYVVLHGDSETGYPYELLILDAPNINDAVNVWRWNMGGLGFSDNGYNGPYETAITADGQIVADFITTGTLIANIIKAGVLQSQDSSSYWDLESGEVSFRAYVTNTELSEITDQYDAFMGETNTSISEIRSNAEGLQSFVTSITETVDTNKNAITALSNEQQQTEIEVSQLQQSVDNISLAFSTQFIGGINYVKNSAGLNGVSDEWAYTGAVVALQEAETKNHTVSNSCFELSEYSTLTQVIDNVLVGFSYRISIRAKKESSYNAYFRVIYNGDVAIDLFNQSTDFDWSDFTAVLPDVQDSTVTIEIYSRGDYLRVSDIILSEGTTIRRWTPAPNEIYTTEVKIDRKGIEVSNSESSQRTVINNTEFAGYYNDEKIFALNKDETLTKKTVVDGELTVGKTKFIPMPVNTDGLNIVILD